ncbi:hypothetical protein, partial [Candidatus Ichthyocystis sparus]
RLLVENFSSSDIPFTQNISTGSASYSPILLYGISNIYLPILSASSQVGTIDSDNTFNVYYY